MFEEDEEIEWDEEENFEDLDVQYWERILHEGDFPEEQREDYELEVERAKQRREDARERELYGRYSPNYYYGV